MSVFKVGNHRCMHVLKILHCSDFLTVEKNGNLVYVTSLIVTGKCESIFEFDNG